MCRSNTSRPSASYLRNSGRRRRGTRSRSRRPGSPATMPALKRQVQVAIPFVAGAAQLAERAQRCGRPARYSVIRAPELRLAHEDRSCRCTRASRRRSARGYRARPAAPSRPGSVKPPTVAPEVVEDLDPLPSARRVGDHERAVGRRDRTRVGRGCGPARRRSRSSSAPARGPATRVDRVRAPVEDESNRRRGVCGTRRCPRSCRRCAPAGRGDRMLQRLDSSA